MTAFWKKMEAPSADTTAESLPAERRGLYAARSSSQPSRATSPMTMTATSVTAAHAGTFPASPRLTNSVMPR